MYRIIEREELHIYGRGRPANSPLESFFSTEETQMCKGQIPFAHATRGAGVLEQADPLGEFVR
jgi:hypothetical protein